MHQMLDQTLMELNNLWKHRLTPPLAPHTHIHCGFGFMYLHLAYHKPLLLVPCQCNGGEQTARCYSYCIVLPSAELKGEVTLNHSLSWSLNWETRLFSQASFYLCLSQSLIFFFDKSSGEMTIDQVPLVTRLFSTTAFKLIWYVAFCLDHANTKGQSGEILHLVKPQHYAYNKLC